MRGELAFSTLGLPGASLAHICSTAATAGAGGVELRVAPGEVLPGPEADPRLVQEIRDTFADAGLRIVALGSYVRLCAVERNEQASNAIAHLRLAAEVGAEAVRVFPGGVGDGADDERAAAVLAAAASVAEDLGVRILLETHDSHPTVERAVALLDSAGVQPAVVGVLWDTAHSWVAGETLDDSLRRLGDRRAHIQVKDVMPDGTAVPLGAGDFPISVLTALLLAEPHPPTVSLEWERAWHPELPPLEEALAILPRWAPGLVPERAQGGG